MATTSNKIIAGVSSTISTSFNKINSHDYTTSQIQENIVRLESTLNSKINARSNSYALAYGISDIPFTVGSPIVFPLSIDQNTVYSLTTGIMTTISDGYTNISGQYYVVSGTPTICFFMNGTLQATLSDNSGPYSFNITVNAKIGSTFWMQSISGNGTLVATPSGLGTQFCLRW